MNRLRSEIFNYILEQDRNCQLHPDYPSLMTDSLEAFIKESVDKFIKGHIEHGGDIRTRDLDKELRAEQIDTFWYMSAKTWKK